ncbi:MAG TPA: rRNA maturation RNase YbeY [Candidatus Pacearchaeota archaeon]|jgi:probable rRNA maturation factor|nr:rRNA maturation RNase YbeY [Candidatus Pacearchaeota archaeon]HPO06902.1 rRNA maturation RNase YbeY [Candidatus Pacearchaeota archaeon]
MEIDIQIRNLTRRQVNGARIKKAIAAAVNGEKKRFAGEGAEISVVLVGKKRMAAINQKYRGVASATDVLSFAHCEGEELAPGRILGELVICPEIVAQDAKTAGRGFDYQTAWVAIHGALHLLGYDHERGVEQEREMRQKEKYYLSKLKTENEKGKTKIKN